MILQRLIIQEWHCFRRVEVDLSGISVASVIGRRHDEPERSNGTGKTYFLAAHPYAVYGVDRTSDTQRLGAKDDTFVESHFTHRGKTARVKRGFKIKTSGAPGPGFVEFDIDGVPQKGKIREINAQIVKFIGCDYETYVATSFFAQGEADQFVRTTAAKRQKILSGLLGLDVYEAARILANKEISTLEADVAEIRRMREIEKVTAGTARRRVDELAATASKDTLDYWRIRAQKLRALQADYEVSCLGLDAFHAEVEPSRLAMEAAQQDVTTAEQSKITTSNALLRVGEVLSARTRTIQNAHESRVREIGRINEMRAEKARLDTEIADAQAWLDANPAIDTTEAKRVRDEAMTMLGKLRHVKTQHDAAIKILDTIGPRCRECDQPVGEQYRAQFRTIREQAIQEADMEITAVQSERVRAEATINEAATRITNRHAKSNALTGLKGSLATTVANIQRIEELSKQHDQMSVSDKEEITKLEADVATARTNVSVAQGVLDQAYESAQAAADYYEQVGASIDPEAKKALASLHARVVRATEHADMMAERAYAELRSLEEAQRRLGESVQKMNAYGSQLEETNFDQEVRRILVDAFSKNGIPLLVMENVISEIEAGTIEILRAMQSTSRVRFRTETTTGRETILIDIETPDGTRELKSFSGGQVTEINMAIRLSLAEVLARRSEVAFQSVFLDEVMAALDGPARQCFMRVVNLIRRGFQQVFVVSHHGEIRDVLESCIVITWHPDGSTVEVAR